MALNTQSAENYLKCIYKLSEVANQGVSTNAIAQKLDTKASSVTDMLKKLSKKGLVIYTPYKASVLSAEGNQAAIKIIRKHRLWEVFLREQLSFSWDEVHEIAEQLEHVQSDELTNRLDAFLDFPAADPHGDPIPDASGHFRQVENKMLLSDLTIGACAVLCGLVDSSAEFLRYLDQIGLSLGVKLKMKERFEFDASLMLQIGERELSVSKFVAENLYVKIEN